MSKMTKRSTIGMLKGPELLFLIAIGSQFIMVWLMGRTGRIDALLPWIVIALAFIISPWGSHYCEKITGRRDQTGRGAGLVGLVVANVIVSIVLVGVWLFRIFF